MPARMAMFPRRMHPAHADADYGLVPDAPNAAGATVPSHGAAPNSEIELKLLCSLEQLAELANSPVISQCARDDGETIDLTAIYYDTPDFALLKSGDVLRVRTDGERCVMTLKRQGNGKALERAEWNAPVSSMEPDLAALSQFLPAETLTRIGNASLNPVFSTEVRRHTRMLETPLGTVELAIDRGRIVAGERSEEISEIELELMDGRTEAIFQLAQELMSGVALRPSILSKSARGIRPGSRQRTTNSQSAEDQV